jgi:hypothetical protein
MVEPGIERGTSWLVVRSFDNQTTRLVCSNNDKKFEETVSIMDSKLPVRHRIGRSADNIAAGVSVAESPRTSIRHRSQQLDIPRSTIQRIVTKDLHMHDHKIQLTHKTVGFGARRIVE